MQDPHKDPPRAVQAPLFRFLRLEAPERPSTEALRQWAASPVTHYLLAVLEHRLHRVSRQRRTSSDEGPNEWQRLEGRLSGIDEAMRLAEKLGDEVIGE